jgi:hypothetical protein
MGPYVQSSLLCLDSIPSSRAMDNLLYLADDLAGAR